MAEKTLSRRVKIAGQFFDLRANEVVSAMRGIDPEPITSHYVVVGSRRFPPKQIISEVTGLDRADFTTHQARRTLMRLGFSPGRRQAHHAGPVTARRGGSRTVPNGPEPLADQLRRVEGQWVAIRHDDVLYSAATPQALVGWLTRHGQTADSVFRVPASELDATGLAPL